MDLRRLTGIVALALLTPTLPSSAQLGGAPGSPAGQFNRQAGRQQRPKPRNYLTELKSITDAIGQKTNARIVVDPALFVATAPTPPPAELAVDKALDRLASNIKNAAWRKVYLPSAQANLLPPAEKLAASVRTLEALEHTGLVLENPATKKATTYLKNYAVTPTFSADLQAGQFAAEPVYVLYNTSPLAEGKTAEERFADLQRQQMEMMMQMTPDEMAQAMQNSMQNFMNMDPQMRQQVMGNMMRAGMQMFQSMSPDQRNQLLQGFGGAFGGPPPGK